MLSRITPCHPGTPPPDSARPPSGHSACTFDRLLRGRTSGGGFDGDNRWFSTNLNASSRIGVELSLDSPDLKVETFSSGSSPSGFGPLRATASPRVLVGWQPGHVEVDIAGSNPLVPFAPDMDITFEMFGGGLSGGGLCVSGDMVGDAFPNAEAFVVNRGGVPTPLIRYISGGNRESGPGLFLPGLNSLPMGSFENVCFNEY